MSRTPPPQLLVLQEFRLNSVDSSDTVERIVAAPRRDCEHVVPLLINIDDPRDVATLRSGSDQYPRDADRRERAALAPFVESWRPLKWYQPRVIEQSQAPPRYYRLAVTESGINDVENDAAAPNAAKPDASVRIALLWIGAPVGTHAGLLILLGHYGEAPFVAGRDISGWPLPLSRELGVRVYEGAASIMEAVGKADAGGKAPEGHGATD